jgi:hypothetical protein
MVKRRVKRHHRGSQNLYIEDEQTTQWSTEELEDTTIVLSVHLRYTDSDYPFGVFKLFF